MFYKQSVLYPNCHPLIALQSTLALNDALYNTKIRLFGMPTLLAKGLGVWYVNYLFLLLPTIINKRAMLYTQSRNMV